MKKFFILFLILSNVFLFCQEEILFEDEIVVHLINYSGFKVEAIAARVYLQGGKWYPDRTATPFQQI